MQRGGLFCGVCDMELYNGDCLELMKEIPGGSVDLVLADPPYGIMKGQGNTPAGKSLALDNCDWDTALPTKRTFDEVVRVLRPNGKCVLFSQGTYTNELIKNTIPALPFSYRAIWLKKEAGNPLKCNKAMLVRFEDIMIFSKVHPKHDFDGVHPLRPYAKDIFDFIGLTRQALFDAVGQCADHFFRFNSTQFAICTEATYAELIDKFGINEMNGFLPFSELQRIDVEYRTELIRKMNTQYPSVFNLWEGRKSKSNVLEYSKEMDGFHPTQKPVALLEDLIKTFSNPGNLILDFTMGSGSTGVACVNTERDFIGIELDPEYFKIAKERIDRAIAERQ